MRIFVEYSHSEYHLENDISVAQYQYYAATQNKTWLQNKGWPLLSSIAEFWASQVVSNSSTGLYDTLNESQYFNSALISSADSPSLQPFSGSGRVCQLQEQCSVHECWNFCHYEECH